MPRGCWGSHRCWVPCRCWVLCECWVPRGCRGSRGCWVPCGCWGSHGCWVPHGCQRSHGCCGCRRLGVSTAASTNAVSLCRAAGLGPVQRLERSRRLLLQVAVGDTAGTRGDTADGEDGAALGGWGDGGTSEQWRQTGVGERGTWGDTGVTGDLGVWGDTVVMRSWGAAGVWGWGGHRGLWGHRGHRGYGGCGGTGGRVPNCPQLS